MLEPAGQPVLYRAKPAYPKSQASFGGNLQLADSALMSNCFGSKTLL